jgi:peptide deformylase
MPVFKILQYPDPRLKQVSTSVQEFTSELRNFVQDLETTMRAAPGGVGIAAPQVSRFERIVLVDVSSKPKIPHHGRLVLINPEILAWEGMVKGREGCMSVPDYTGNVIRAEKIQVRACDEHGQVHDYAMQGFEARAVQHEIDHLDGLLFLDRLVSRHHDLFRRKQYQSK